MSHAENIMKARVSRRKLLKGAGALGVGLTLGQTGIAPFRPGALTGNTLTSNSLVRSVSAQEADRIQDILDITVTTEMFGVTILGAAIQSAREGNYDPPIPDAVIGILEAARAQEQFHLDFFRSVGGEALTQTFHLPDPALLTDSTLFFDVLQQQESREIAAQIAAFSVFTEMNRPDLLKASFQYAAEEAEHRLLANYAKGARPANNLAFAPKMYETIYEFLNELEALGIIGGDGPAITYPGPGDIDPTGVINTEPDDPQVMCSIDPGPGPGTGRPPVDRVDPKDGCRYFEETGHNVCGAFLDFWNNNGGLAVFGLPLTEEFDEENFDTGEVYVTQYFERQRFEWHPENAGTPYEILLGRMGAEILAIQGRDWRTFPKGNVSQPHYFPETGHAIAPEFWEYWSSRGLDYGDAGVSFRESLLLFGYPLSEPNMETNEDGDSVMTQWFERAVFERHPNNDAANQVLLRRLGWELLEARYNVEV